MAETAKVTPDVVKRWRYETNAQKMVNEGTNPLVALGSAAAGAAGNLGLKVYSDGYGYDLTPAQQQAAFTNKVATDMRGNLTAGIISNDPGNRPLFGSPAGGLKRPENALPVMSFPEMKTLPMTATPTAAPAAPWKSIEVPRGLKPASPTPTAVTAPPAPVTPAPITLTETDQRNNAFVAGGLKSLGAVAPIEAEGKVDPQKYVDQLAGFGALPEVRDEAYWESMGATDPLWASKLARNSVKDRNEAVAKLGLPSLINTIAPKAMELPFTEQGLRITQSNNTQNNLRGITEKLLDSDVTTAKGAAGLNSTNATTESALTESQLKREGFPTEQAYKLGLTRAANATADKALYDLSPEGKAERIALKQMELDEKAADALGVKALSAYNTALSTTQDIEVANKAYSDAVEGAKAAKAGLVYEPGTKEEKPKSFLGIKWGGKPATKGRYVKPGQQEVAPAGRKAMLNGKILVSDGAGGWK